MNFWQQTISHPVSLEGIGLHTGKHCRLTLMPAPVNYGICFVRTDIPGCPPVPARTDFIADLSRGTTLGIDDIRINTIEHVMASLRGCNIDNARVEIDGPEPPAIDGSSRPYVDLIQSAGIKKQGGLRQELIITKPVSYTDVKDNVVIKIFPAETFRVTFLVDYPDHLTMGTRFYSLDSMDHFAQEIAPARTYGLLSEMKVLKQKGLGKGGSLDNNLVFIDEPLHHDELETLRTLFEVDHNIRLGNTGILDERPLRFTNEPVRHKILDLIGDLYLLGMPVRGHILAFRSGHKANAEFVKQLQKDYKYVINTLVSPEPGAGLLVSLLPDLGPVPPGFRILNDGDEIRCIYDPLDENGEYLNKGLVFRLAGLSAGTTLLFDNVQTIKSVEISNVKDMIFYKELKNRQHVFISRIREKNAENTSVSFKILNGNRDVVCEGEFTFNIERYV